MPDESETPADDADPSPPREESPEDVYDEIFQSLVDDGVTYDDDGNAIEADLDASYCNLGRGHHEAIGLVLGADDGSPSDDDAGAPADDGAAPESDSEPPLVDCGTGDPWDAPDTTDDPMQDGAAPQADAPPADSPAS